MGSTAGMDVVTNIQISILASLGEGGPTAQIFRLMFILKFMIKLKYMRNPKEGVFSLLDYVAHFLKLQQSEAKSS